MKQTSNVSEQYHDAEILYLIFLIKSAVRGEEAVPLSEAPENLNWQRR